MSGRCAWRLVASIAIAAFVAGGRASAASFDFEVVAYSGGPAPGVPGAVFDWLSFPSASAETFPTLSATGRYAFRGMLEIGPGGVTASDAVGVWVSGVDGSLTLLARTGQPLAGTPDFVCTSLFPTTVAPDLLLMNAADQVMLGGRFRPIGASGSGTHGIAAPRGGALPDLVVVEGSRMPGAVAPFDAATAYPDPYAVAAFDDAGRVTFLADTSSPGAFGFWRSDGAGAVAPIVLSGELAPGMAGLRFTNFGSPVTSRNGALAFWAAAGSGYGTEGIWVDDGAGGFRLVLHVGEAAAGIPGATYQDVTRPDVNVQRQTAIAVWLEPGAECDTPDVPCSAVYRADPSGTEVLVTGTGAPVSGPDGGAVFGNAIGEVLLNDFGMVAFAGTIFVPGGAGFEEKGAVFGPAGFDVAVRARVGAQAAGLPEGIRYERLGRPLLNNRGEIVFWAQLEPARESGGLFFVDANGGVWPVLRVGQSLDVAGVEREIAHVTTWGTMSPRRPFNDRGEFGFAVRFTDGGHALVIGRVRRPSRACGLGVELLGGIALVAWARRRAR